MTGGSFLFFINFKQAARFGHIGWGFQVGNDNFCFGSADHLWKHSYWDISACLRYMHVPEGGDIDWWEDRGTRSLMLETMKTGRSESGRRHINYDAFKEVSLGAVSAPDALRAVEDVKSGGWHILRRNCVKQAYLIFSSYSAAESFPDPFSDPLNLIPKKWFAKIPGECKLLQ